MKEGFNRDQVFGRISDLEVPPLEYYKLVGDFNLLMQKELSQELTQNAEMFGSAITLITPGSDARLEKGSFQSPLEVIALTDTSIDPDAYMEMVAEAISKVSPTPIAKIMEVKGGKSAMIPAYNNSLQPGRIADGRLIYGSPEVLEEAKIRLGKELVNIRRNEVHRISDLRRNARKVVENGRNTFGGKDAIHFDLTSGEIFFNPEANQLSFKVGPLRLVQNTLLVEEVKHTRRENDPKFISTLDSNIVSRLGQLSDDKMINLNKKSVEEIMEHYAFFLRLYHRSERAYDANRQVAIQLQPTEVQDVAKRLQALSALMQQFKIQK